MFGLGFWEIVAILFLFIVLVNPKDWPKLLYRAGKLYGAMTELFASMTKMVRELDSEGPGAAAAPPSGGDKGTAPGRKHGDGDDGKPGSPSEEKPAIAAGEGDRREE